MKSYLWFRGSLLRVFAVLSLTCVSVASTKVKVMTYNADEGTDF